MKIFTFQRNVTGSLLAETKWDLVEEYVNYAKKKWAKDADKLEALVGTGMNSNSLNPQYSWLCYADKVSGDDQLRPKLWEFKKMVRDLLNKLAFSEDEDDVIEVDPFTDVDEGLPVMVKYMKNPNKKKGENYYDVSFPKKVTARPLSDEEIEHFLTMKPLSEVIYKYEMRDFEKALEGLQNFDDENEIGLFEDEDWLEHVEEIKAQYESDEEDEEKTKSKKKTSKKVVKKEEPEESDDEEADEEPEESDDEEADEEAEEEAEEDELDELDRNGLKKYIRENELEVSVKKSMSDDDIREAIREAMDEEPEEAEEDEEEDEKPKAKVSLSDIKKKLAGKK
jgi:chemotaxis protein histidine kinase CheA